PSWVLLVRAGRRPVGRLDPVAGGCPHHRRHPCPDRRSDRRHDPRHHDPHQPQPYRTRAPGGYGHGLHLCLHQCRGGHARPRVLRRAVLSGAAGAVGRLLVFRLRPVCTRLRADAGPALEPAGSGSVSGLFTEDFTTDPYWWDASPRPVAPEAVLPAAVDVVVVGSGYTGLHAALVTARAGRSTLVLEKDRIGEGCSTRNGGQISTSIQPSYAELARRHGADAARAILREGRDALDWIGEFTRAEGIDCDFSVCGRLHAAHSPRTFDATRRDAGNQVPGIQDDPEIVSPADLHREIGTDVYHGGVVHPHEAVIDPGRYHAGLLTRVQEAGATVVGRCAALGITREGRGFLVDTPRGKVAAREVVIATNG